MASSNKPKKLWILVKRFDLIDNSDLPTETLREVIIQSYAHPERVHKTLRETLNIQDASLILKLRNNRGSLVPINSNLVPNSKTVPYTLDVVRLHQFIKPIPRTITSPKYEEAVKGTLNSFITRVNTLEGCIPELGEKRKDRIVKEVMDLERKLVFLNKRFHEAESSRWQGMFKKQPMW